MHYGIRLKTYFRFYLFIIVLTISFLPIVPGNMPPIIGSYRFIWAPIWLLSITLFYPKIYLNKQIVYFLFYGIVFLLILRHSIWSGMRSWDQTMVVEEYYIYAICLSTIIYFRLSEDFKGLAIISKWTMVFIAITAILTINASIIDPLYVRDLVGGAFDPEKKLYFERLGGGSYGFAGTIIGLFPIMIYYYKNNEISIFSKKVILLFGLVCFVALVRMQIFTNILLALLTISVSLLGSKRINLSVILVGLFIFFLILIPIDAYSKAFVNISQYFDPKSEIYYKLNDTAEFITDGNLESTGTGRRVARYPLLFDAFLTNPLWGYYASDNPSDISEGGHLYWMNKLTIFGIIGFIPFLLIHFFFVKKTLRYFQREYSFYYLVSVFAILGLGFFKNLVGREMWFLYFVLLHGLYYLPLLKQKKNVHLKNTKHESGLLFSKQDIIVQDSIM